MMWGRPKRMQGKPGIWAKEVGSTWTIFSVAGIVATDLTREQTIEQLKVLELKVVPHKKGETWSLKNKP